MLQRLGIPSGFDRAVLVALILLIAISPMGKEGTNPITLGIYRTILLTLVGVTLVRKSNSTSVHRGFATLLFAALAWMLISVYIRPGSHFDGVYVLYKNALFLCAWIALSVDSPSRATSTKRAVLAAVVLVDLGYLAWAFGVGARPLLATFVNPNYFASFLVVGFAVCVAGFFHGHSFRVRTAAACAGLLIYLGIGQTSSRGATIAAVAVVGVAFLRAAQDYKIRRSVIIFAIAGLAAITIAVNPALVRKFMDRGQGDPYNYQRTQIWLGTASMIRQHPVLGLGPSGYYYSAKLFTPAVRGTIGRYGRWANIAHSEYLQYIAELGIPGALLFFALIAWLLARLWQTSRSGDREDRVFPEAAILAAVAIGSHAVVDNNWSVPVVAAAISVLGQADMVPRENRIWNWTPVRYAVAAIFFIVILIHSTLAPAVALYFNEAGHRAYLANDVPRATFLHRMAIGFAPDHPVLLDNLGMVYFDEFMKSRDPDLLMRAESLFRQSSECNPGFDTPLGHLESALIQKLSGRINEDRPVHEQIVVTDRHFLSLNPFNPFVRRNLAEALHNLGEHTQAMEELLRATEIEPNYVPGYLRLAQWAAEEGHTGESQSYQKRAIEIVAQYRNAPIESEFDALLLGRPRPEIARP